jgi:hypothetical protein
MGARRKDREQGIYRRVTVRMWGDAKVMALSRPQPCGQVLWIHLLTGEQTDAIPGLCKIGEAAFAEQLGWSLEGFREAFREVAELGMAKADWKARVVWVPKAIEHNAPASPNVVKSWADAWDRIPECQLKAEAWRTLRAFLEGMGEAFRKPFDKACPTPSAKTCGNQEQEQEQIKEALSHAHAREAESQPSVPEAVDAAPPPAAEAVSGTDPCAPSGAEQRTQETTDAPGPGKPAAPDVHAGAGETTTDSSAAEGARPALGAPAPMTAAERLAAALPTNCPQTLELLRQLELAEGFLGSVSRDRASRSVVERAIGAVTLPVALERMLALIRADKAAGFVTKPWMVFHLETIEGRKPGQRPGAAPARRTHGDLGVELDPWWKRLSRADRERFQVERASIDPKLDGAPYPATGIAHHAEVEALIERFKALAGAAAPGAAA